MRRASRYLAAVAVAAAVTGGVALTVPRTDRTLILLAGVVQVYAVGTAVALRYTDTLRQTDGPNWASAAFAGVTTFGGLVLLHGVEPAPNLAAAALGFGLATFGLVVGVALERERRGA